MLTPEPIVVLNTLPACSPGAADDSRAHAFPPSSAAPSMASVSCASERLPLLVEPAGIELTPEPTVVLDTPLARDLGAADEELGAPIPPCLTVPPAGSAAACCLLLLVEPTGTAATPEASASWDTPTERCAGADDENRSTSLPPFVTAPPLLLTRAHTEGPAPLTDRPDNAVAPALSMHGARISVRKGGAGDEFPAAPLRSC